MLYDKVWVKDPDDVLDYSRTWDDLLADGEVITSSQWIVPSGITEDSSTFNDTSATVWLSGGTAREDYYITNRITTDNARTMDRTFLIKVREK